jgi:acetyltransferase
MAGELAGRTLLDGWRGGPVLDRAAFGRLVAGLGDLLLAHPHLQDVELNPLRVTTSGLIALDAVIIAAPEDPDGHADR